MDKTTLDKANHLQRQIQVYGMRLSAIKSLMKEPKDVKLTSERGYTVSMRNELQTMVILTALELDMQVTKAEFERELAAL